MFSVFKVFGMLSVVDRRCTLPDFVFLLSLRMGFSFFFSLLFFLQLLKERVFKYVLCPVIHKKSHILVLSQHLS